MLGIAVSSPMIISLLDGCVPKKELGWTPTFFNEDQARLVAAICDTILPKTETPGALEVGVDAFVDHMVNTCLAPNDQQLFIKGLEEVDSRSQEFASKNFISLSQADKNKVMEQLQNETLTFDHEDFYATKPFFLKIKELTLLGYFTSEVIMTLHLAYTPIPARLEGCVPLNENQKLIVGNHI